MVIVSTPAFPRNTLEDNCLGSSAAAAGNHLPESHMTAQYPPPPTSYPDASYARAGRGAGMWDCLLPVSLDFSSWKCHVLAALGDSRGSCALLRQPAFGASGDQTAGTRHQLTWTKRCHSHAEFIVSLRRGAAAGAGICPGAIPIASSESVRWVFFDFKGGYALHNAFSRLRLC